MIEFLSLGDGKAPMDVKVGAIAVMVLLLVRPNLAGNSMEKLRPEYEQAVRAVAHKVFAMRGGGTDAESVARFAHAERQRIALAYKGLTPEPLRARIRERTIAVYGQATGPSIEYLRQQGKSWEQIADGASRPGRQVDEQ
jgi:hypothetical protein